MDGGVSGDCVRRDDIAFTQHELRDLEAIGLNERGRFCTSIVDGREVKSLTRGDMVERHQLCSLTEI